ncbi:MAG: hypothetical protein Q9226_004088 [Calogaya cf. arnoldii]
MSKRGAWDQIWFGPRERSVPRLIRAAKALYAIVIYLYFTQHNIRRPPKLTQSTVKSPLRRPLEESYLASHARHTATSKALSRYEMTLHGTILGICSIATPLRLRPP